MGDSEDCRGPRARGPCPQNWDYIDKFAVVKKFKKTTTKACEMKVA